MVLRSHHDKDPIKDIERCELWKITNKMQCAYNINGPFSGYFFFISFQKKMIKKYPFTYRIDFGGCVVVAQSAEQLIIDAIFQSCFQLQN